MSTTTRGSIKNHGILQTGNTTVVLDDSVTGGGKIVRNFVISSDTVVMGLFIRSLSGSVGVKVYTVDGVDTERRLVLDMGTFNLPTQSYVIARSQLCMGMIRVEIHYTSDCDLRLVAKPSFNKDGDAREEAKDAAALETLLEERAWREGMLSSNNHVVELLMAIRNHLREITSIEDNKGDIY